MSNQYIKTDDGRAFRLNTPDEDARITAAAMADPDCMPYSEGELEKALSTAFYGHPASYPLRKSPVTMRIDNDLLAFLKSTGVGWQTRLNKLIRENINSPTLKRS
jgi:uncharacterized protein (DUF4415 family)